MFLIPNGLTDIPVSRYSVKQLKESGKNNVSKPAHNKVSKHLVNKITFETLDPNNKYAELMSNVLSQSQVFTVI